MWTCRSEVNFPYQPSGSVLVFVCLFICYSFLFKAESLCSLKVTPFIAWQANEWPTGKYLSPAPQCWDDVGKMPHVDFPFLSMCILRITLRFPWWQSECFTHPDTSTFLNIYVKKNAPWWGKSPPPSADGCGPAHWDHTSFSTPAPVHIR